ncbi:MAG: preprotein translocase subunit SecA, partial [Solirubrobacteraceae bacterium]
MTRLAKILGDPINRELKRHRSTVDRINELEDEMTALSDEQLRTKTDEFRARLGVTGPDLTFGQTYEQGLSSEDEEDAEVEHARREAAERRAERRRGLDELLPEAFAVVREAAR